MTQSSLQSLTLLGALVCSIFGASTCIAGDESSKIDGHGVKKQETALLAPPDPLAPDYTNAPRKEWEQKFSAFQFKTLQKNGHVLPYRFYQPATLKPGGKYPLVLFFHGAGERGVDNRLLFMRFATVTKFWEKYPCFVLAPQCPSPDFGDDRESVWVQTGFGDSSHRMKNQPPWPMQMAMELLDKTISENPIDTNRVYVTGLSMGGFATWEILQRQPGRFAGAVPVCGGADLTFASKLANTPIWVFHGSADKTVPPSRSRDMVEALISSGGHPLYTEYPDVGHDSWGQTYLSPLVWDWLFNQSKR